MTPPAVPPTACRTPAYPYRPLELSTARITSPTIVLGSSYRLLACTTARSTSYWTSDAGGRDDRAELTASSTAAGRDGLVDIPVEKDWYRPSKGGGAESSSSSDAARGAARYGLAVRTETEDGDVGDVGDLGKWPAGGATNAARWNDRAAAAEDRRSRRARGVIFFGSRFPVLPCGLGSYRFSFKCGFEREHNTYVLCL